MQIGPLPTSNDINIGALAGSFGSVTNSYKFYWMLALLDAVQEQHQRTISLQWLLCRMVAHVWHPVHYFRLQFGKSDKFSECAELVKLESGLAIDASVFDVTEICMKLPKGSAARRVLEERGRFVPYRFIRPFFETEIQGLKDHEVNGRITDLASQHFNSDRPPMYRFVGRDIELAEAWFLYISEHLEVLRGFCYWHLVLYLQAKNPNVGNLASKLTPPVERDLSQAKKFWQLALKAGEAQKCIYSGFAVPASGFSLDHFLPWSFVAHDALWNICPTLPEVNSAKGDRLPSLDGHLSAFLATQFEAVQRVCPICPEPMIEDYSLLFGTASAAELIAISRVDFNRRLGDVIRPQFQIAANCGFPQGWFYGPRL